MGGNGCGSSRARSRSRPTRRARINDRPIDAAQQAEGATEGTFVRKTVVVVLALIAVASILGPALIGKSDTDSY